jgi:hypothetical protein
MTIPVSAGAASPPFDGDAAPGLLRNHGAGPPDCSPLDGAVRVTTDGQSVKFRTFEGGR